jgi:hypothetical protein
MKDPEPKRFNRKDLGDYLVTLGEQIRQGALQAEGRTWPVPGEIEAEIHLKEKKGRISAKLQWHWPTLTEYDQTAVQEIRGWQDSFKTVKSRLAATFKELQRQASQGESPFFLICQSALQFLRFGITAEFGRMAAMAAVRPLSHKV